MTFKSCSNTVATFSFRRRAHLLDGIEDVLVNVVLCVNGEGVVCGLVVVLEEEVLERHGVLLLEGHYHMVADAKEHQLRHGGGKVFQDYSVAWLHRADATQTIEAFLISDSNHVPELLQ